VSNTRTERRKNVLRAVPLLTFGFLPPPCIFSIFAPLTQKKLSAATYAAGHVSAPPPPVAPVSTGPSPLSPGDNVVVPLIANSLEFTLSSPPPLHQFQESPLVVETDHLKLNPGKEAEDVLREQGHVVTDIIGKEKWLLNDAKKYEGLIPQNIEWTEFVDEKTGEWVYLDEYGDRVEKPASS
jgi:hypothetical protein